MCETSYIVPTFLVWLLEVATGQTICHYTILVGPIQISLRLEGGKVMCAGFLGNRNPELRRKALENLENPEKAYFSSKQNPEKVIFLRWQVTMILNQFPCFQDLQECWLKLVDLELCKIFRNAGKCPKILNETLKTLKS